MCQNFADEQEMKTSTEWLKHNKDPLEVKAMMKDTAQYRRDFIHTASIQDNSKGVSRNPDLDEILQMFPHILDPGMV